MLVEVLCISRRPAGWVADATAEYARRLTRGIELKFVHLAPGADSLDVISRRRDEALRIIKRIRDDSALIALDVGGRSLDSEEFAAELAGLASHRGRVTFVIGGADGLDRTLLERATGSWSLSHLTMPHQLVQVVIAEQVYRAWSILEGHPYHRS